MINSRAHICSCQHIICQELGAPFASASVFFFLIQFRHNTGKTTEIVISTVAFCVQFFVFGFFVVSGCRRHAGCKSPQQQLAVATSASASTTSTIANRQRHQLGARLACISFLLRLHLTLFCCPLPSVCLSVSLSVILSAIRLSLPLSFSLLFSCLAVDHLSSFYGAHVLCPRFTSCLTFNSRPSPKKQQQQQQQLQLQQQHQRTLLPSLAQTEPSLRFINRT